MEGAINQLQDLGITRTQATKALARYNNDVSRAADFIFSGNYISDDEEEITLLQEQTPHAELNTNSTLEKETKNAQATSSNQFTTTDQSNLSVVLYKDPQETFDQEVPRKNENNKANTTGFSLTWWEHPRNPSERKAFDNLPIGLRPPAYSFNYSPITIQALFHISFFQFAVISYRPVIFYWGAPEKYWEGKGEPIPGYITREKVKPKQTKDDSKDEIEDYNDIDETCIQEEIEEDDTSVTLEALPKCLQSLGELQKIFAFLRDTKRSYGTITDFTKTLNNKPNYWDDDDIHFETFLDLLINNLIQCDEYSDASLAFKQDFKR